MLEHHHIGPSCEEPHKKKKTMHIICRSMRLTKNFLACFVSCSYIVLLLLQESPGDVQLYLGRAVNH